MKFKLIFIVCILLSVTVSGQSVSGIVSTNNEPLAGVSILVKGTDKGAYTDFDGKYILNDVTKGNILVFSYLGFKTQEITYTDQLEINVNLVESSEVLDEVVIINYGKQRNTPVSTIKADKLSEFPNTDIGQALQGRAAGVSITNGGSPGTQTLIQIRGTNTFGDGTPLFVVDGVYVDNINSLDLASIEKVDILKDAAALAIYGSRGTNGVILITTKKGKIGKTSFKLEANYGLQTFSDRYDVLNTEQYIQYLREINGLFGQNGGLAGPLPRINNDPTFDGNGIDTDWQDAYFTAGSTSTISLNVNGGTEKARFNIAASHFEQEGVFIETGFTRTTLNLNSDAKINSWLNIGQTLSLGYNETVLPEIEGGRDPFQNLLGSAPYIPVVTSNGLFGGHTSADVNDSRNQIRIQNNQDNLTRFASVIGSLFAKIDFGGGFTFRSQFGINGNLTLQDNEIRAFQEDGGRFQNPTNFISKVRRTFLQTVFTNTLSFEREFGKHSVNASAVLEQLRLRLESSSISDNNNVSSEITEAFSPNARSSSFSFPENLNSILFLAGYDYDDRYSLNVSARRDISSRFAEEFASEWFFSAGIGWNISNESFFKSKFISNLKFRASIGESGNNRTGFGSGDVNQFLPTLGVNLPISLNNETVLGISPNNLANSSIRWETQVKENIGVSLGLLNNQFTFTADYFSNNSNDLLIPVNAAPSSGVPGDSDNGLPVIQNVGSVNVDGFEFSAGYNDFEGDFKWGVTANLTTSESIVESLGGTGQPIERAVLNPPFDSPLNRLAEGLPTFHFFGLVADGVFSTQAQIDAELPNNNLSAVPVRPGDVRFLDINGDGQISLEDRDFIGDPNPDFTYALNFRFEYKGFDADILFNGVQGVDVFNTNIFFLEGQQNVLNGGVELLRRFQNPGDITDVPRFRFGSNINNTISSRFIEDASFLRLRNVTVGYTFPNELFKNGAGDSFLSKVRVYAQGQNLLTLTNYSGLDPEIAPFFNAFGLVDGLGIDRSAQPRPVTVLLGLQIEF